MNKFLRWSLAGCLSILLLGCGEQGEPKYPVTGTVTLDGQPISGAIVAFNPKGTGRHASGITDQSGVYRLTTDFSCDGALADDYSVTIVKYQGAQPPEDQGDVGADPNETYDVTDPYPEGYDERAASAGPLVSKNLLPTFYGNDATSGLTAQVQVDANENVFDFQLKR